VGEAAGSTPATLTMEPDLEIKEDREALRRRLHEWTSGKELKPHDNIEPNALCVCFSCQTRYLVKALEVLTARI
jgi:hypothetical protein